MRRHTTTIETDAAQIDVRDVSDAEGGAYRLVSPISGTTTARDGEAFTEDRLTAFQNQIERDESPIPLMVDHGKSEFGGEGQYSVLGRIGTVDSATLTRDGGATLLEAEMSVADPDALAERGDTGEIEAALRYLKYQAETLGLSFSVGWTEDSARTDGPELLEVSAVAIPSDVTSSTASADPPEAAVRGFEGLSTSRRGRSRPKAGLRGYEEPEPDDATRASDALDALAHVRELHTEPDETPVFARREETPAELELIDDVREVFRHGDSETALDDRIEALRDGRTARRNQRETVLARLDALDDAVDRLAQPETKNDSRGPAIRTYPFGRSYGESRDRIAAAVETLRDVVTESTDRLADVDGRGLDALARAEGWSS